MPEEDPFELYKRRKAAQERAKQQGGGAPPPAKPKPVKRRPTASVPKPKPRPAVPGVRPKGEGAPARPKQDVAPGKVRVVRHKFDKADVSKMGDDREFEVTRPKGLQKHAFHADDAAKMGRDPEAAPAEDPAEAPKARGLVRHKFDRADLQSMGDDRNFEPAKPAGMHAGAFHEDDVAEMRHADAAAGGADVAKPKGLRRHKFAKEDIAQMSGERATDVGRPAGFESGKLGAGVGQTDYEHETEEEAAERRAREKGPGLLASGHTRRLPRELEEDHPHAPPPDDDDGGQPE